MKIILKCLFFVFCFFISNTIYAQVGINTAEPDASSVLDIFSESKGLLMPRLSTEQRDAILRPAKGLMIYNRTSNDGELNIGTPTEPLWLSINNQNSSMMNSVAETSSIINTSRDNVLLPGMTLSPPEGTYMVMFSAQVSSNRIFNSNAGVNDINSLYSDLMSYPNANPHASVFGNGETLFPGVYDVSGAPSITGILTLDGGTDIDPIFIIRGAGAFTTGTDTTVILKGNAKPENIFWVSGAAMSTGANTIMKGTMLGGGVSAGAVSLGSGSNLEGRLLTKSGVATLSANVVLSVPTGNSPINLGSLSTFAMWSSSDDVSDEATSTTTGDVGSASQSVNMTGIHNGEVYTAGETIIPSDSCTFSIYQNGEKIEGSTRTTNSQSAIVYLQSLVTVSTGSALEIRWRVEDGKATLNNRTLSIIRNY